MRGRGAGEDLGLREGTYQSLEIRIAKHSSSKPLKGSLQPPEDLKAPAFPLLSSRKLWGWLHHTVAGNLSPDVLSPAPLPCSSQASCSQNYACPPTSSVTTSSRSQNKHAALQKHTNPCTRKEDTERKRHSTQEAQEHKTSLGAKRDNSYPLYLLFSPSTPPSSSFPVPHGQTQRVSSAGILARGSRTLDVPGSQSFRPCSISHLCSSGARRLGGGLKVGHPEPVYVLVLEALQWGFQEPHLSKVWSFLTMAPLTGLKKWWYAASKGTLCARKRPFTGRELTSILTSLLHHWFPLHPSMGEVGPII